MGWGKWQLIIPNLPSDDANCSCSSRCAIYPRVNKHSLLQLLICKPFFFILIMEIRSNLHFMAGDTVQTYFVDFLLSVGLCWPSHSLSQYHLERPWLFWYPTEYLDDLWYWWHFANSVWRTRSIKDFKCFSKPECKRNFKDLSHMGKTSPWFRTCWAILSIILCWPVY